MTDLIRTLLSELAAIESDMTKLSAEAEKINSKLRIAAEKSEKLKAVIALYDRAAEPSNDESQAPLFKMPDPRRGVYRGTARFVRYERAGDLSGSPITKAAMVKAAVINLLHERGSEHRQNILGFLVERGLMGTEKNPMGSLAAYLSDYKDIFASDGKGNFSLRLAYGPQESVSNATPASDTQTDQRGSHPH